MYDIITIGSATVDVLVKTKPEIINHKKNHHEHTDIAYHLGEKLLIDNLAFTTGGGGTNTAVAFSRLGLKTGFIGCIANDINGEMIARDLKKENVEFLGKVKPGKTGYSVILPGSNDRTILAYKGVNNSLFVSDIPNPLETKWLYISSMLGDSFDTIEKTAIQAKRQGIRVAFNISRYLAQLGLKKLKRILNCVDILVLNKEEAAVLTDKAHTKQMLEALSDYIPGIVVITNGPDSIYALSGRMIYVKHVSPIRPVDKTGSGDAFASGFVYGIMQGKGVQESLNLGHKEALAVMAHIGAKNNLLRKL